jgi:hypothetical protein
MRSKAFIAAALVSVLAAGAALAQVGPQPAPPAASEADAESRLAAAAKAYRESPTRESVTIRVKNDRGRVAQSTITIAVDPGRGDGDPRRLRMELGQLVVTATDLRVLAAMKNDAARYAEFTLPEEPLKTALEKLFPSLALPQLVLADAAVAPTVGALGDLGLSPSGPSPVRWRAARVDRATGRQVLEGDTNSGALRLTLDRATSRLRSAELTLETGAVRVIDISVRPIEVGDPATWAIDTAGRTAVDSLSDLTGAGETLRVGHAVPKTLLMFNTGGTPWHETSDRLASVLVLTRFDTRPLRERADLEMRDATFRELRRTVLPAIKLRDQLQLGSEDRYNARCVALIDEADLTVSQAGLLFRLFDSADNLTVPDPRTETLLLAETSADLDPILAGGLAAAVIVDTQRIVRGIVTLDDPASAEKRVREILDNLLKPPTTP